MRQVVSSQWWRVLAVVALSCCATGVCAPEISELWESKNGERQFKLDKFLGSGSFSRVYRAELLASKRWYAIKFYRDPKVSRENRFCIRKILDRLSNRDTPNILKFYPPEKLYAGPKDMEGQWVLISELTDGAIEDLADLYYNLTTPDLSDAEVVFRVGNGDDLFTDVLSATEQYFGAGLIHNDMNPRNVLRKGKWHVVGDPDGATVYQEEWPKGDSWELEFAAIEYHASRRFYKRAELSEIFTAASTVYFAHFGISPITQYAKLKYPEQFRLSRTAALRKVRWELFYFEEEGQRFEAMIAQQLASPLKARKIPQAAQARYARTARRLRAALKPYLDQRKNALREVLPDLVQWHSAFNEDSFPQRVSSE